MNSLSLAFLCIFILSGCVFNSPVRDCSQQHTKISSKDIEVTAFQYGGDTSKKSLIIIPPTGRTNYIDRKYAEEFCDVGYDVYIMDGWSEDEETVTDLEIHQHFYGQAQKAVSTVLDKIKSHYVGILGTSVGALHASIAASLHDRIQAVFTITGGISIAEVIVTSDQKAMVDLKKNRKNRFGFKDEKENIEAIQKVFTFEPEKLPKKFVNKDLGVSIALEDATVPTPTQLKLKEFWNPKKVITYPSNHFWGIVKTWLFDRDSVVQFFEDSYNARM